jgi:nucleosome assembly protein 1-like 1
MQNPALLNMMQDRLGSLVGKPSGYLKSLPPAVKRRVEGLKGIQTEHSKIESEFQREILEIEKKVRFKYHSAHVMSVWSDTR